jgi:WD40 repeat protein
MSPTGGLLALGTTDRSVQLWDYAHGRRVAELPMDAQVHSVAFSRDGSLLASGSDAGTIQVWDTATLEAHGGSFRQNGQVTSIAFSPNARLLATGSTDWQVRLWDVASGTLSGEPLAGHTWPVMGVAFSPDGQSVASISYGAGGAVRLWSVSTRQSWVGELSAGQFVSPLAVAFSPDGKILASSGFERVYNPVSGTNSGAPNSTVWLWNMDPEYLLKQMCQIVNRDLTPTEWSETGSEMAGIKICRPDA